jgi:hypothetical protein
VARVRNRNIRRFGVVEVQQGIRILYGLFRILGIYQVFPFFLEKFKEKPFNKRKDMKKA